MLHNNKNKWNPMKRKISGMILLFILSISNIQAGSLEESIAICENPTMDQKHTLRVLAKKVYTVYSPTSCSSLYERLNRIVGLLITESKIKDISPLKGLTNLEILSLWKNQIHDISPLKNMSNIETLNPLDSSSFKRG